MEAILFKKEFSENTLRVYVSVIARLMKLGFKYPNKKNESVKYIKTFFSNNKLDKTSTRLDLLNVVIVLRLIQELPTEKLKQYRGELAKERLLNQPAKMNELKKSLMSKADFETGLMNSYENGEYKKFVINFLMLNYGTRNMDNDVRIIKDAKEMTDDKKNYLIFKPKKVTWVRNTYKTSKTFGTQTHIITDPEFISAVKKLGFGDMFRPLQLSNEMKKLLINAMNEAKIFKMLIDDAYVRKDTNRINELSKSRGTSIGTIMSFYDINTESEGQVIRKL